MSAPASFVGSIAIVTRGHNRDAQWLAVWDDVRAAYRFIEARRVGVHSYRTCLIDPIEDELDLVTSDYLLSDYSLVHHQSPIEWPGESLPAWVVVQFFPVHLYGRNAEAKIDALNSVRWWSMEEIATGRSKGGEPFCERQHLLILRSDILPPWATSS